MQVKQQKQKYYHNRTATTHHKQLHTEYKVKYSKTWTQMGRWRNKQRTPMATKTTTSTQKTKHSAVIEYTYSNLKCQMNQPTTKKTHIQGLSKQKE